MCLYLVAGKLTLGIRTVDTKGKSGTVTEYWETSTIGGGGLNIAGNISYDHSLAGWNYISLNVERRGMTTRMDADAWVFHESDCANPDTANTNNVGKEVYEDSTDSYFCTGNTLVDGGGGARSIGTTPLSGII